MTLSAARRKRRSRIMVYGATGFTGRLVAEAAQALDCEIVLAGRDAGRVDAAARPFGFATRAFALDEPARIVAALDGIDVVLNAAGPVVATAGPLIAACLDARTHYLDVTGEFAVFVAAHRHHAAARRRGIMIMPGIGFWIVASDCLAADVAALVPNAKYLRIGCCRSELLSRGSLRTVMTALDSGIVIRRAGRLSSVPVGRLERQFDYGQGMRTSTAVTLADVFTAFLTTGIPNIEGYFESNPLGRSIAPVSVPIVAALRTTPLRPIIDLGLAAWPEHPQTHMRGAARQVLVAEAEDGWRRSRCLRMVTSDGYSFTAAAAAAVLKRVTAGDFAPGFQTPGKLYGPGLALAIPGTRREELGGSARHDHPHWRHQMGGPGGGRRHA
jgi:short subunit dehydrogenase-like uncharacterized protein